MVTILNREGLLDCFTNCVAWGIVHELGRGGRMSRVSTAGMRIRSLVRCAYTVLRVGPSAQTLRIRYHQSSTASPL